MNPSESSVPAAPPASRPIGFIRRYLGIYAALWKNSVAREMTFKSNFLLWIFVELLWFGLQLSFIGVIYLHTDTIGTWTKWQVVLLVGASHFIQQIFQAFFLINCTNLSELVRTGKLDFLLLLPVNTRFIISLRQVDLGGFVNAGFGGGRHGLCRAPNCISSPTLLQIVGFLVLCVAGILIHYSLMFLLASISFWTVRAQGIVWGYYNLFNIARMPDEAFQGIVQGGVHLRDSRCCSSPTSPPGCWRTNLTSPGPMLLLVGHVRRLPGGLGMGLAPVAAPLYEREFLNAIYRTLRRNELAVLNGIDNQAVKMLE